MISVTTKEIPVVSETVISVVWLGTCVVRVTEKVRFWIECKPCANLNYN